MKYLLVVLSLVFSFKSFASYKCEFAKKEQALIEKYENDLRRLEAINSTRMEDPELRVRLKNSEDEAEVGVLAEQLDEEVQALTGAQFRLGAEMAASTGAIIVSRIVVKKLKALPDNHKLKIKYFKEVKIGSGLKKSIKGALNFSSLMFIASDIYIGYKLKENHDKKKLLARLIVDLNKMEHDLNEKIIPLKEELTAMNIEFDEMIQDLIQDEVIEIRNNKIICL